MGLHDSFGHLIIEKGFLDEGHYKMLCESFLVQFFSM
jgi:hypothetical protein